MRLFLGLWPSPAALDALVRASEQLRRAAPHRSLRSIPPDQIHLTLRFLGEIPDAEAPRLAESLHHALAGHHAPLLQLGRPGAFPSVARPRVIWVGLGSVPPQLLNIHQALAAALAAWPWVQPEDHPFHPHFTLARLNPVPNAALRSLREALERGTTPAAEPWVSPGVRLVRSRLDSSGATYETLDSIPLLTTR